MKIENIKVNHYINPIGYYIDKPVISWKIKDSTSQKQKFVKILVSLDENLKNIIYKIDGNLDQCGTLLDFQLEPMTRYYYQIKVVGDQDEAESRVCFFETAKSPHWDAHFIGDKESDSIIIYKDFLLNKPIKKARLYICGLGLYEAYLNHQFINNEYLMPGFHSYNDALQYQTYDVTNYLISGNNHLEIMLGNGWYKGRIGYEGGFRNIFGDHLAVIFELHIEYTDLSKTIILSDTSCCGKSSPIIHSGIYDGELYDANKENDYENLDICIIDIDKDKLIPRLSLPIVIKERREPVKLIISKKNEMILDFGQNITGWVEVHAKEDFHLYFSEVLQDDCFYNENYRTATFGFQYISDGKERHIRPHFTFYGFRYVKIVANQNFNINQFEACLITSDLDRTGFIETGNQNINQLISNVYYSQIDNFLDIPTDCPQRDERLGWTGDAQVFCDTACYNSDATAFYNKYLFDMRIEQKKRDGGVCNIIPVLYPKVENYAIDHATDSSIERINKLINMFASQDSSPWADAATIIPWNVFMHSGDKYFLKQNYENMKSWVDHVIKMDQQNGEHHLFDFGFHFADWLALDNPDNGPFGKTDMYYVSSIFYYHSVLLVSQTAQLLNKKEYMNYAIKAQKIKEALRTKYIHNGRVTIMTQTALVLAIYFRILNDDEIPDNLQFLVYLINKTGHIDTGFIGTAYINDVLAKYNQKGLAYNILLNEDFPGWINEIKLGATTIWERWNSILSDGHMNTDGMNSLNHYAYGSIAGWLYRYVGGITPIVSGFKKVLICPVFDRRLKYAKVIYNSAMGEYMVYWKYIAENRIFVEVTIPFNCEAIIKLPQVKDQYKSGNYHFIIEI